MNNLKEVFGEKFFNDLVNCNFLSDVKEIIKYDSLINIDLHDFVEISKSEIVGSISQYIYDLDEELNYYLINDKEATDCILMISADKDLSLKTVDKMISKIKAKFKNAGFIYGTNIVAEMDAICRIQALFTYSDKKPEEEIKVEYTSNDNIKIEPTHKKLYEDEKDLLYEIVLTFDENPISINGIQNSFGLGFNRAARIIAKLEELGIISRKTSTDPRTLLIKNEEEIKKIIYGN